MSKILRITIEVVDKEPSFDEQFAQLLKDINNRKIPGDVLFGYFELVED